MTEQTDQAAGGVTGQNTLTADTVGAGIGITSAAAASIAGHAGDTAGTPMTATEALANSVPGGVTWSDPKAQALEEAWREQLVNDIVARLQQKALAAVPPPAAPAPAATPKPSPSRIVIFRDGTGNEYPAVITRVYSGGAVALFVFRDDSNSTHSYGAQTQIDPSSEGQLGWFWPPRV